MSLTGERACSGLIETGLAIAQNKPVLCVSPDWWSFSHLPTVRCFTSLEPAIHVPHRYGRGRSGENPHHCRTGRCSLTQLAHSTKLANSAPGAGSRSSSAGWENRPRDGRRPREVFCDGVADPPRPGRSLGRPASQRRPPLTLGLDRWRVRQNRRFDDRRRFRRNASWDARRPSDVGACRQDAYRRRRELALA